VKTCHAIIGATMDGRTAVLCGSPLPCRAHDRPKIVHLIDPDFFVRTRRERPWCSHGRYVPLVEDPDQATCQLCLRRYLAWEAAQAGVEGAA
jgi:hypothetical protein